MTVDQRVACTRLLLVAALAGTVATQAAAVLLPHRVVPVHLLIQLVAMLASVTLFVLALARPSGGDTAFVLRGGSFATSSHRQRYFTLGFLLFAASFAGSAAADARQGEATWHGVTAAALLGLGAALHTALAWADLPRLELRPDGVRLAGVRDRTVPWQSLRPGTPLRGGRSDQHIALTVDHPQMLPPALRKRPIIELGWDAHPWFVADAIRWYVEHPEERPAIGTPAAHDRLTAVLTATATPAAKPPEAGSSQVGSAGR